MPPQGDVARQWFIPGDGIERAVISGDVQRYLGNDATVRPGAGTGTYEGVNGYWIKAYRNLTNAMIADLRADSQRWRQEQRQTGVNPTAYVGSSTYHESNAAGINRRDGNSPGLDPYGNPPRAGQMDSRQNDPRRQVIDPMQDAQGRGAPPNQAYGQQGYYQQDARGQYQDPAARGYPPQGRAPGYPQEQPMADVYGQPDAYGRYAINPAYDQQGRQPQGYAPQQGPPPGYARQGDYWVPATSGYAQPGMVTGTLGPPPQEPGYFPGQQQPQQVRAPGQPPQRDPRDPRGGRDPAYGQPDYNPYPSPAQTVANPERRDHYGNQPPPPSGYGQQQGQYDRYGQPVQQPPYSPPEPGYAPPTRDVNQGRRDDDRRRRR